MFVKYYRLFGNDQLCQKHFKVHYLSHLPVVLTNTMTIEHSHKERLHLTPCHDYSLSWERGSTLYTIQYLSENLVLTKQQEVFARYTETGHSGRHLQPRSFGGLGGGCEF